MSERRAIPPQDRGKDTEKALLDAAEEVARRVGFEAATPAEITEAAGVSAGAIQRYFPSKDALLNGLVKLQWEAGLAQLGAGLSELPSGPLGDTIDQAVRLVFRMIATRLEAFERMRIEASDLQRVGQEHVDVAAQLLFAALEHRKGELVVQDLETASSLVVRTVAFLGRLDIRDYQALVQDGRYETELCAMVRRYLVGPTK